MDADAVVCGAGPAGAAAALRLRQSGLKVAVLMARQRSVRRIEVLSPRASRAVSEILPQGTIDMPEVSWACDGIVSRWTTPVARRESYGEGARFVDREALQRRIETALGQSGALLLPDATASEVLSHGDGVAVVTNSSVAGWRVRARFAIDATGRASALARALGARRRRLHGQVAYTWREPLSEGADGSSWFHLDSDAACGIL